MGIDRKIEAMRERLERSRPAKIMITFADGSSTTTDPAGAIDIFRARGPSGNIAAFTPDSPEYDGLCGALSALCHPVPDRRIEDFE